MYEIPIIIRWSSEFPVMRLLPFTSSIRPVIPTVTSNTSPNLTGRIIILISKWHIDPGRFRRLRTIGTHVPYAEERHWLAPVIEVMAYFESSHEYSYARNVRRPEIIYGSDVGYIFQLAVALVIERSLAFVNHKSTVILKSIINGRVLKVTEEPMRLVVKSYIYWWLRKRVGRQLVT